MSSSRWPRSPSHGKCSRRFCGSSRNCGRSHHQRQRETFDVMHSRAIDRRSASKCQGKWPDQTLDQAFGLSEVLVAVSTSRLSLQEGQENAHIPEGLSGRRLLQQRRQQLEWIRFEQLLGEQCRVFRHHSAQDTRPRLARFGAR